MCMIFILIETKFDIDINNYLCELLIIIWEHKSTLVVCSNMEPKLMLAELV